MDPEVIREVLEQPAAIMLEAANAVGNPDRVNVTWVELAEAGVGHTWVAAGGGELFNEEESATVVWRDSSRVVVWYEWIFSCPSSNEYKKDAKLMAFAL